MNYNPMYPEINEFLDYDWKTFKFTNIVPKGKEINFLQIDIKHNGLTTDFTSINKANHKLLLKVYDPMNKGKWRTPWMDACDATTPKAMFPVDGTRCICGELSTTESRVCFIGPYTPESAIFYIRLGIPIDSSGLCVENISLEPIHQ